MITLHVPVWALALLLGLLAAEIPLGVYAIRRVSRLARRASEVGRVAAHLRGRSPVHESEEGWEMQLRTVAVADKHLIDMEDLLTFMEHSRENGEDLDAVFRELRKLYGFVLGPGPTDG